MMSEPEKIANRIVGAFIIEDVNKARKLTERWIEAALAAAHAAGMEAMRELCAQIADAQAAIEKTYGPDGCEEAAEAIASAIRDAADKIEADAKGGAT